MRPVRAPGDPLPEKPPVMPVWVATGDSPRPPRKPPVYVIGKWPLDGIERPGAIPALSLRAQKHSAEMNAAAIAQKPANRAYSDGRTPRLSCKKEFFVLNITKCLNNVLIQALYLILSHDASRLILTKS